jgi:general secretion pathway protein A
MYKEFFELNEYPFSLTPDPRFIVFTPKYNELLAGIYYGVEMAKGLMMLTGEVGTGKTTALRWIIRRLDSSVLAAYIFNPHLTIDEFYQHLSEMLGLGKHESKTGLLMEMGKLLEDRHKRGLRTMLIVDEAHELSDELMEEIRLLLNFESDSAKFLQIILTGQPELKDRLRRRDLRQLKQRIALRCEMPILSDVGEVERFIVERTKLAGAKSDSIFNGEAIELIYQCSEGIPRQVNNLCDNSLIAAFAANQRVVTRKMVEEVASNLDLLPDRDSLMVSDRMSEDLANTRVMSDQGFNDLISKVRDHEEVGSFEPV